MNIYLSTIVLIGLFVSPGSDSAPVEEKPNKLLYILIDAFRYDYVDMQPADVLPGFNKFLKEGVRTEYMSPIFPSISYPNWNTLLTGLWAESHGIVANYMYDPSDQSEFDLHEPSKTGMDKWWTAEPIWTTAKKAGLKTGAIRWSNCEIQFDGVELDYCAPFDIEEQEPESFKNNTEKAVEMITTDYDLVHLYTPYIDTAGHYQGPETEDLSTAVQFADNVISYIMDQLEEKGMTDKVNIVIVSDHGMKDIRPEVLTHLEIDDYLDSSLVEKITESGAFMNIKVLPGNIDQVYESLSEMPGVEVYKHDDIPGELHYKDHHLIHDILLKVDNNTYLEPSVDSAKQLPPKDDIVMVGAHGFDSEEEKMRAIFFAKGPDFQQDKVISPILNVDVYPLLAQILHVDPLPNNGSLSIIQDSLL